MKEGKGDVLEYVNWKDRGCDLSPACLECPLPRCVEDVARGRQKRRLGVRSVSMSEMWGRGNTVREIAAAFTVSIRTVQRVLQASRGNGHSGEGQCNE
jgi:hypothetical protein